MKTSGRECARHSARSARDVLLARRVVAGSPVVRVVEAALNVVHEQRHAVEVRQVSGKQLYAASVLDPAGRPATARLAGQQPRPGQGLPEVLGLLRHWGMRVTVCELRTSAGALDEDWAGLVEHVSVQGSDLVVLPEMCFAPWFAAKRPVDEAPWTASVAAHQAWLTRLGELQAAVIGTRPVDRPAGRRNEAYTADVGAPVRPLHDKSYLPDEPGFWEASWYGRGAGGHAVHDVAGLRAGVLVCTELWFLEHARAFGRDGAHLIATPRCTPAASLDTWLAGGRACAVLSGAWSLSSNSAQPEHGGLGWAVDPEGQVVATTSRQHPYATVEIDLADADAAKDRYPRYVPELLNDGRA